MSVTPEFNAFAVLGLPPELTLGDDQLDNAWRELSRELHPDADSGDAERAAEVNRAKEILHRPSTRLRHWLELHGVEIPRDAPIDDDLMNLFAEVGAVLQGADSFLRDKAAATTVLGKALLADREVGVQQKLQAQLADLQNRKSEVTDRFSDFESSAPGGDFSDAITATGTLGFLDKWERQIQERLISLISSS